MRSWRAVIAPFVVMGAIGLTAAAVSPAAAEGLEQAIIGNVVGGRSPDDRITLGRDANGCTATVEAGRGHGHYGAPVVHRYTIPGLITAYPCPDMGVVVHRRHAHVDDLAVTWFIEPPGPAHDLYLLRHLAVLSGSAAMQLPSYIGTRDFNGDGRGDVWEITDEGDGLLTYLRQGRGFVPGPAKVDEQMLFAFPVFGHLDDTPGTDLATFYFSYEGQPGLPDSAGFGVVVVFGATGKSVLLERDPYAQPPIDVAIVDADHDGHNDVVVTGDAQGTGDPGPPRVYLGDGRGHFRLQPQT